MTTCDVLIVGGGPAGLRAAELVSATGLRTVLADHKPSVGRKFLVAGRGGLNLTHSEPVELFSARYGDSSKRWNDLLAEFSPGDLRGWAKDLGIETFIGTSGRVFPESKQAAPLLRRWIERLRKQGVSFRPRHQLTAFRNISVVAAAVPSGGCSLSKPSAARDSGGYHGNWAVTFSTPEGDVHFQARAVIFALGGASWPQTGSDGGWVKLFSEAGVNVAPLTSVNCGYEVAWPESFLAQVEGQPLKNIVVRAGEKAVEGELLITKYGIEGGAIYQLGRELRSMSSPYITIDLKPSLVPDQMLSKLAAAVGKQTLVERAARAWRLSSVAKALLESHAPFTSPEEIATVTRAFPLTLRGPRPIEEAISSAGGVRWEELEDNLMLKRLPGLFCAGEMIDWDAPTGGYLLQGCFSTATRAAEGTKSYLESL
jgi:predicted flavoprotein YhiN